MELYENLQKFKDELNSYYQMLEDGIEPNWRFSFFDEDVRIFYSKLLDDEKEMYKKIKESYDAYKERTKELSASQKRQGLFRRIENKH